MTSVESKRDLGTEQITIQTSCSNKKRNKVVVEINQLFLYVKIGIYLLYFFCKFLKIIHRFIFFFLIYYYFFTYFFLDFIIPFIDLIVHSKTQFNFLIILFLYFNVILSHPFRATNVRSLFSFCFWIFGILFKHLGNKNYLFFLVQIFVRKNFLKDIQLSQEFLNTHFLFFLFPQW